ncbi:SEC-C metal-binding domain-containing protein, partial [Sphingobacterium multivorum]|uniref:SEC-C metal-binding domain-containing protein n=1 Tax=Sphingobacterium multivorum TaxID=28454 RepID=UPI0028A9C6E0
IIGKSNRINWPIDLRYRQLKNPKAFFNSKAGGSIMNDWRLDNSTNHKISIPGRNEPCPCGSGIKFKKCHGFR